MPVVQVVIFIYHERLDQSCFPFLQNDMKQAFSHNLHTIERGKGDSEFFFCKGSLRQVLECATKPGGKILNAVDVPMLMGTIKVPFATDIASWKATVGLPYCKDRDLVAGNIRCAHAGTKDAYTPWRIAKSGFCMYFTCNTGKIMVLVDQGSGSCNTSNSPRYDSCVQRYMDSTWEDKVNIEIICLEPGDTMYAYISLY